MNKGKIKPGFEERECMICGKVKLCINIKNPNKRITAYCKKCIKKMKKIFKHHDLKIMFGYSKPLGYPGSPAST